MPDVIVELQNKEGNDQYTHLQSEREDEFDLDENIYALTMPTQAYRELGSPDPVTVTIQGAANAERTED